LSKLWSPFNRNMTPTTNVVKVAFWFNSWVACACRGNRLIVEENSMNITLINYWPSSLHESIITGNFLIITATEDGSTDRLPWLKKQIEASASWTLWVPFLQIQFHFSLSAMGFNLSFNKFHSTDLKLFSATPLCVIIWASETTGNATI
jgi:hypothetical protein